MKKGWLVSIALASLLGAAHAAQYQMHSGFNSMIDIQEHINEAQNSSVEHSGAVTQTSEIDESGAEGASNSAMAQASSAFGNGMGHAGEAMEHAEEARSSAMAQASSAFSNGMGHAGEAMEHAKGHNKLLELVEEGAIPANVPEDIKEVLKEVKKAVKFFKHPELFEDLNITDITDLDPETIQKIEQKVEEAKKKHIERVKQKLLGNKPKAELPIAGEFVRIGDGQYDWVFVTKSGNVYKLAGVDENGKFKYEPLEGVKATIDQDGKVIFQPQAQNLPVELPEAPTSGYPFVKYNDPEEDGFDWLVVTKSGKVYKFEGFDEDSKSFFYTPVDGVVAQPKGDEVEILPGS